MSIAYARADARVAACSNGLLDEQVCEEGLIEPPPEQLSPVKPQPMQQAPIEPPPAQLGAMGSAERAGMQCVGCARVAAPACPAGRNGVS